MKKVSIVLPTYNGESYIEQAIQSILVQTYENWELIIVDDCSTDKTYEIISRYVQKDQRIQVIRNVKNQKLPQSLNIGFRRASGAYFTWTSDDNYYDADAIETMVSFLNSNPEYGMVYCDINDLYEDGTKKYSNRLKPVRYLYLGSYFGACFLYRREVAEAVGEYDSQMFLVEDYDYLLRIAKQFQIYYLRVCKYTYRIHRESLSQTRTRQIIKRFYDLRIRELDYLLEKIDEDLKPTLFLEMWFCKQEETWALRERFFPNGELPQSIKWLEPRMENDAVLDNGKKLILFGAGELGKKALSYFGKERVYSFVDNDKRRTGTSLDGIPIIAFEQLVKICDFYQLVLCIGSQFLPEVVMQVEDAGIAGYALFLELWLKD